jgi:hypothetical protein
MSRVLGTVSVMHLEADDLATVEIQNQVEIGNCSPGVTAPFPAWYQPAAV